MFGTLQSVSQFRYPTIWVMGGGVPGVPLKDVWYGNLDTSTLVTYPLNPDAFGQPYQFNTFENATQLVFKNQSNFWALISGTLTQVTDPNYPAECGSGDSKCSTSSST